MAMEDEDAYIVADLILYKDVNGYQLLAKEFSVTLLMRQTFTYSLFCF